jgi:hypothetical protein
MADVYVYADETGNLDYAPQGKSGATPYFGFGTATYRDGHGEALQGGLQLRVELEHRIGANERSLADGFHAIKDSKTTKAEVFAEIQRQAPRIDATLLLKENAYPRIRSEGEMRLYKLAWFMHLKYLVPQVTKPGDRLIVIVATLGTARRLTEARAALRDVCSQVAVNYTLCVWNVETAWGLQVADYALWAVQRRAMAKSGTWWDDYIRPTTNSVFFPWGQLSETPSIWR